MSVFGIDQDLVLLTPLDFVGTVVDSEYVLRTPLDPTVEIISPDYVLVNPYGAPCPPPPDPPDDIAPVVDNFDPAPGTQIEVDTPLRFSVTDNLGSFTRTIVTAKFPDGSEEIIHDWDSFNDYYAAHSARIAITNGFRYTVRRTMGWPGSPTIRVFAIDSAGNEAV